MCQYLQGHRGGEVLDTDPEAPFQPNVMTHITQWADWTEYECTHMEAQNEKGCPFLDDNDVECPIKENHIWTLHHWAIQELAGDRQDKYSRVRELMQEAEV